MIYLQYILLHKIKAVDDMKKWAGLLAVFAVMIGVLYFLWVRSGIFFAVSISESAMFNLKVFAVIAIIIVVMLIGFLLFQNAKK